MTQQLLAIGEKAVKTAERLGAKQAEVYLASARSFSIDVENSAIKSASERRDAGCGIRSVIGKRVGFAYVTTLLDEDIEEAAKNSVGLAKASVADPSFVSLPSSEERYPVVSGLYDRAIVSLQSDNAAEVVIRAVDAAKAVLAGKKFAIEAQLSVSSGTKAIVSSQGMSLSDQTTSVTVYTYPTIKEEGDQTASYEYQISRRLKDIDPEWVGRSSSENALHCLGAKTVEGGVMPVILAPLAVSTVIGGGFAGAINAEEVQFGRSYISDAIGARIASEELHIVDDGILKGGVGSRVFDAEGVPSQRTEILSGGVLKSLLHNSYTANKDRIKNTGNASRPSYAGTPYIASSNFMITPRKGTLDNLVSELRVGVLCRNTGDRPNMTTGDLSAMVMEGFYIKDGEVKHPVKSTLVGINMRDLLQRVHRVGADTRTTGIMVTPSIVVESAQVTSG